MASAVTVTLPRGLVSAGLVGGGYYLHETVNSGSLGRLAGGLNYIHSGVAPAASVAAVAGTAATPATTVVVQAPSPAPLPAAAASADISNAAILTGAVVVVGAAGATLYLAGMGLDDVVWVSRKAFRRAHATLSAALDAVRDELGRRIGRVEQSVEKCRASVEAKVAREVGAARKDVAGVARGVADVRAEQAAAAERVRGLRAALAGLDGKVDGLGATLGDADSAIALGNRGTALLCRIVAQGLGDDPLLPELERFTTDFEAFQRRQDGRRRRRRDGGGGDGRAAGGAGGAGAGIGGAGNASFLWQLATGAGAGASSAGEWAPPRAARVAAALKNEADAGGWNSEMTKEARAGGPERVR